MRRGRAMENARKAASSSLEFAALVPGRLNFRFPTAAGLLAAFHPSRKLGGRMQTGRKASRSCDPGPRVCLRSGSNT